MEVAASRILRTDDDVVIVQAEAALALEAVLHGVVRPGTRALCLSSGAYGAWFANELRRLGAEVTVVEVGSREAIDPGDVELALARDPSIEVVAFVHGESLSGNLNPAPEICKLVRRHGALCIVDAVASIGAHRLEASKWGIDLCIAGPQKALAGSSGSSLVSVSDRAWQAMRDNPQAPRGTFASLLDWKDRWIDAGRTQIPGTPSIVEMLALEAALARVLDEGLDQVIARHERAARGCRAGVRASGSSSGRCATSSRRTPSPSWRCPTAVGRARARCRAAPRARARAGAGSARGQGPAHRPHGRRSLSRRGLLLARRPGRRAAARGSARRRCGARSWPPARPSSRRCGSAAPRARRRRAGCRRSRRARAASGRSPARRPG